MIDHRILIDDFCSLYGSRTDRPRLFWAPGRVNLIGEHTDYNDGFVLPIAIDLGTMVVASPRADRLIRVHTAEFGASATIDLDQSWAGPPESWTNYVEGIARSLEQDSRLVGADVLIKSDLPMGAGLSSSAALEMSVGLMLLSLAGHAVDPKYLALAGQRAEHQYVGIKCGIMDQYVVAHGQAGHALLIDCRSIESDLVSLSIGGYDLVITDTHVKHELASSQYNKRRAECERGVDILRPFLPGISALRDVNPADFARYQSKLPEPIRKRCRHVISENDRTLAAARLLRDSQVLQFGQLMFASHASLRNDYEVSCAELDFLVQTATRIEGVAGSRMTGGGFGGCTVSLLRQDGTSAFIETTGREYTLATGAAPSFYVVTASDGAREVLPTA